MIALRIVIASVAEAKLAMGRPIIAAQHRPGLLRYARNDEYQVRATRRLRLAAIFAAMPYAQDDYLARSDLIPQFVIADDEAPHFPGFIDLDLFAEARISQKPVGRMSQLAHDAGGGFGRGRAQEIV